MEEGSELLRSREPWQRMQSHSNPQVRFSSACGEEEQGQSSAGER